MSNDHCSAKLSCRILKQANKSLNKVRFCIFRTGQLWFQNQIWTIPMKGKRHHYIVLFHNCLQYITVQIISSCDIYVKSLSVKLSCVKQSLNKDSFFRRMNHRDHVQKVVHHQTLHPLSQHISSVLFWQERCGRNALSFFHLNLKRKWLDGLEAPAGQNDVEHSEEMTGNHPENGDNHHGMDVHEKSFCLEGLGVLLLDNKLVKVVEDCDKACILEIVEKMKSKKEESAPNRGC